MGVSRRTSGSDVYAQYGAFSQEAQKAGVIVGGDELDSNATATTVRVRGDETLVTDGPFAELKEALGGYFVLRVRLDRRRVCLGGEDPGRNARRDRGPRRSTWTRERSHEVRSPADQQRRRRRRRGRRCRPTKRRRPAPKRSRSGRRSSTSSARRCARSQRRARQRRRRPRPSVSATARRSSPTARLPRRRSRSAAWSSSNCEDLDAAIAIAARIPVASRASVELRPVIER